MPLTDAMKARVLDAIYQDSPVGPAATLYVALSTTAPSSDGSNFTRPSGNGYSDVAVTNNETNWPNASEANPSVKENGTTITFPEATGSWGTITHWGVAELDGGTVIDWAPLDASKEVVEGDIPRFQPGELTTRLQDV